MLDALSITEIVIMRDGKPCRYDKVKPGVVVTVPEVGMHWKAVEFRFNV